MSDLTIFGKTFTDVKGIKATDTDGNEVVYGNPDYLEMNLKGEPFDYSNDNLTSVASYALYRSNVRSVNFPNLSSIKGYAFAECTNLTSVESETIITEVGARAFYDCSNLVDFPFENLSAALNDRQFYNTAITRIYAPRMSAVGAFGSNQFNENRNLVTARFPNATSASRTSFLASNPVLKLADLGKCTNLGTSGAMFGGCPLLEVLILRKDNGVTVVRTNEFGAVTNPVTVYVPTAQKANYEANANWASLVTNSKVVFADLEGSPYESIDFDDSAFFE